MSRKQDNYDVNSLSQDEVYEILSGNSAEMEMPVKKSNKHVWKWIGIFAAIVAVIAAGIVGVGMYFESEHQKELEEEKKKQPKPGMTMFLAEEEVPEKSKDEVTSLIAQACYTNDGSMAVYFAFANGMEEDQHITSVEVKISNDEKQLIASGYSDAIEENFVVPKDGTANLLLYISPEYVKITDDPLDLLSYDITIDYQPAD